MKLLATLLISSLLADIDAGALDADAGVPSATMQVEITGLRNDEGHVLLALYRPQDGFSETKPTAFRKQTIPAHAGTLTVQLDDLPIGTYAIALIHDENDNLKIDTGFFGIPTEGFCFSRGAMGLFGAPSFKDAAVAHLDGGGPQKLIVKY